MTETEEGAARRVLLRRQESASQRNSTIRRRSTLRSFKVSGIWSYFILIIIHIFLLQVLFYNKKEGQNVFEVVLTQELEVLAILMGWGWGVGAKSFNPLKGRGHEK